MRSGAAQTMIEMQNSDRADADTVLGKITREPFRER